MQERSPLDPSALCRRCDPAVFSFETTADLPDPDGPVGQARAVEAVRLAMGLRRPGFNLFAMGPPETGKLTLLRAFLERRAADDPTPPDVCYVHDFRDPHRPRPLYLPAGRGRVLRQDLERLVEGLRAEIPAALESEALGARKQNIEDEIKERHEEGFQELRAAAEAKGVALIRTPIGFAFAPTKDGEVFTAEQIRALTPEDHTRLDADIADLQERLRALMTKSQEWARDARDRIKTLLREALAAAVAHLIDDAKRRNADLPEVLLHLEAIRADVVENVGEFLHADESGSALRGGASGPGGLPGAAFRRYLANLFVDNGGRRGAAVVHEGNPTLPNLIGRVEHEVHMSALVTDFHLIRAGALHRANGGYLLLDARDLLMQPYAWEALKQALRSEQVRIESFGQALGLVSTVTLEPVPVKLDVKVVLVGDRRLQYLLDEVDPELRALFKVVADFSDEFDRTPETEQVLARHIASVARNHGLRPLDRPAVACVVERSARVAGDSGKLSAHMGMLADLLREADHWAGAAGHAAVGADDVRRAVRAEEERSGRVRDLLLAEMREGSMLLDTSGRRVGQVNGLSVLSLGRTAFGRPCRITAKVRLGKGEVVDVERAVELSGPIHSKGVMILSSFLGARYATEHPLSLSATLVFEQSYGMIEGDSASCAELCALLSALADVPLAQNLAVTGSVDQHGQVQPVGGLNEKIEGFFDACAAIGARDDQGVMLPATNVRHLMLRDDVVEAARAGRFRVHAVRDVDEAMEILTGLPAGVRGADGKFPDGSVNARVEARLIALAERRIALGREPKQGAAP